MGKLKSALQDNFFKNSIIYFTGSMVVAVLNYFYHPVLGRMMDLEAFGEVQALISLSMLIGMVIVVFRIIVVNIESNTEDEDEKRATILTLEKLGLYLLLGIAILIIIFSNQLKILLNFRSFYPFISLAIVLVLSLIVTTRQAVLQGLKNFTAVSMAGIINSAARLIFAILLVYIGLSTFGAITALIIAQIITLVYLLYKTKGKLFLLIRSKIKITAKIKKELSYGLVILFSTLCVAFLYTADVIIVKYYFLPIEAGLYSGIATIARIIFFLTGSIAGVLLPSIKLIDLKKENKRILLKAMILVVGGGGLVLLLFLILPNSIISLLIGQRYVEYANILPRLGLLSFLVSIINLLFFYFLALKRYFILPVAIAAPSLVLILSYFNHSNLLTIINNFILGSVLVLLFIAIKSVLNLLKKHSHQYG